MKNMSQMKILEKATIKKITAKEPIKSRLLVMGMVKGAQIKILEHTLIKQTWDVFIISNNTKIVLRGEEARGVLIDE